jgi:hypothetical protein
MAFWHGIIAATRNCSGLWRFLIVRTRERAAIELERERNRATAAAIQLLPPHSELLEYEPQGRLRVIRMSGWAAAAPTVTGETLSGASGELDQ